MNLHVKVMQLEEEVAALQRSNQESRADIVRLEQKLNQALASLERKERKVA